MLKNSSILITGGTGSFGNSFVPMTLKKYNPKRLVILSRDEMKQWEMAKNFQNDKRVRFFIGDVRDKDRLYRALAGVDYVVHAAATKIVPSAEYNPFECIKTNINGAMNLIDSCIDQGIKKVVALSTDKASSPINLYGATKLASDKLFVSSNSSYAAGHKTRFSVVRYGNVGFSRGSVIPVFLKQKKDKKNYFTITDKQMTRFWITLEQSVKFTAKCFERMHGAEIFVPKIPSVRVIDIATAIDPNYKMKIVGIRPGEKLHEVLCSIEDNKQTIEFKDYYVIIPAIKIKNKNKNFKINNKKEKGKLVKDGFVYDSGSNDKFMNVSNIRKKISLR